MPERPDGLQDRALVLGQGDGGSRMSMATNPMDMSTATPKNGPRQLIPPSNPPSNGPTEIPSPNAASYRMTAFSVPALETSTITARAVAINKAFPNPQPALKPTMPEMPSADPAS